MTITAAKGLKMLPYPGSALIGRQPRQYSAHRGAVPRTEAEV